MAASRCQSRQRRGVTLVWSVFFFTLLCAIVSFAVDYGHVQLAKTELARAADAAARYAAGGIIDGTYVSKGHDAAFDNKVDGTSLVLDNSAYTPPGQPKDIEVGNWDSSLTPKFSTSRTPANAVRITARRIEGRGTGIGLGFARMIGMSNIDLTATAICANRGGMPNFIGLTKMTANNNTSVGYDPRLGAPGGSNVTGGAVIGSNGAISFQKNLDINGQVLLGPSGTYSGTSPTPLHTSADLSYPNPPSPPTSSSGTLDVSNKSLPGGTYVYDSINMGNNSSLTFTGPTTLYVINDIIFSGSGTIAPTSGLPADLKIRIIGSATSVVGGSGSNNVTITGQIYAPNTDFIAKNNGELRGSALFRSMSADNNLSLYYDTVGGTVITTGTSGGSTVVMVQ